MIGYLSGRILKKEDDRILLLAGAVGYEVLLPPVVMESLVAKQVGDEISLHIVYQQSERQPRPLLIGFNHDIEKEFFQSFITVEDIGPQKALKAMTVPIGEIARAIEARDVAALSRLKGIGGRTAQKIVATLQGRMGKFALLRPTPAAPPPPPVDVVQQVLEVMVSQLGHRRADAMRMIAEALKRRPGIATPEELFEEVYRGEQARRPGEEAER
ncbi:MAG: Holliday junction branch migration protein RuvA [Desulfobacterales bacterium]